MSFNNILEDFNLSDTVEVDCLKFVITVRRMDFANQLYRLAVMEFRKSELAKKFSDEEVADANEDSDFTIAGFCYSVIESWTGIVDDDGNEVEFSPEVAYSLLTSGKAGNILFSKLRSVAISDSNFKESAAKN